MGDSTDRNGTTFRIPTPVLLTIFVSVCVSVGGAIYSHERRVTVVEENDKAQQASLAKLTGVNETMIEALRALTVSLNVMNSLLEKNR